MDLRFDILFGGHYLNDPSFVILFDGRILVDVIYNGWGLGLNSWRTRSERLGARPRWFGARPGRLENKSRMVGG